MVNRWLQHRADSSLRPWRFARVDLSKRFDDDLDTVIERAATLLLEHGVFHVKINFAGGFATIWSMLNPYNYQVYSQNDFLASNFIRKFNCRAYPVNATVPPGQVRFVLEAVRALRDIDAPVSLRTGSLNIINGMVKLEYSDDSSHCIHYRDFLQPVKEAVAFK